MLRALVLLLVLSNVGYLAWSQGMLTFWGIGPETQSEPQRVLGQIAPQTLRVMSVDEAQRLEASLKVKPASNQCLIAGPMDATMSMQLQQQLSDVLPPQSWVVESSIERVRWTVYMGPYATADALNKKQAELRALGVKFELLRPAGVQPGLSLGSFSTREEAERRLAGLPKGVRTARVVPQQSENTRQYLRLPSIDESAKRLVDELVTRVPNLGPFRPC